MLQLVSCLEGEVAVVILTNGLSPYLPRTLKRCETFADLVERTVVTVEGKQHTSDLDGGRPCMLL